MMIIIVPYIFTYFRDFYRFYRLKIKETFQKMSSQMNQLPNFILQLPNELQRFPFDANDLSKLNTRNRIHTHKTHIISRAMHLSLRSESLVKYNF